MFFAFAALLAPFTPPQPWALGFAAPPRLGFAGDVDGDGLADLIVVYPEGDTILDVNLTVEGVKSGGGVQALPSWAGPCAAATVGEFDATKGTDVIGLFGHELKIAGGFREGRFRSLATVATLPESLAAPRLATLGRDVLAYSANGDAVLIDPRKKDLKRRQVPHDLVWIGDAGGFVAAQEADGTVLRLDAKSLKPTAKIGVASKDSRPAAGKGWVAFGDTYWTPQGSTTLPPSSLPSADSTRAVGDFDGDGDLDLVEYRYGAEPHTGNEVLLRRFVSKGETDPDHDGLTNEEEKALGTDPLNPDTDGDGLLDGWEVKGVRGLDLKALGCDPRHADAVCLVSRFASVNEKRTKAEFDRVVRFYADLSAKNPDGKTGIHFVPVYQDAIEGFDERNSWQTNREKFRPQSWRGIVHWAQITPGGGGQSDELSDGSTCGEGTLWAVFVHEFGHQLGMNHDGFWANGWCPIYTSLMNYNYSYSFEGSRDRIHYSEGPLVGYTLRETDLDETIPLPYDKVSFLEKAPYSFRLRPNGDSTLIDWNWNGVFGEKHVRADINYAYSTQAGRRDDVGRTDVSPWLLVHEGAAHVLYGKDGKLLLRPLRKPYEWDDPTTVADGLTGDPVGVSVGGRIIAFYPTKEGLARQAVGGSPQIVVKEPEVVPSVGTLGGRPLLLIWNPTTGGVRYGWIDAEGRVAAFHPLDATSTNPVGLGEDTLTHEAVVGMAQDQDAARPNRWQVRRYAVEGDTLTPKSTEWVEGPTGQARGTGRVTVLFDPSADGGPQGRLYLFGRGMTDAKTPNVCTYVAMSLADKTAHDGWLVKRFYDEWTTSRSAPTAAWFGGDIVWGYRWFGGANDDTLHVAYKATGIQDEPMGDFDDVSFVRNFGLRHSILSLGASTSP